MSYFALRERFKKKDNPDHLQPNLFLTIQNLDPDVTMVLSRTQSSLNFSLHLMDCTIASVTKVSIPPRSPLYSLLRDVINE